MKNAEEEGQMSRLMQEGGIADDGMKVEPVTGNEIPPGSLAEEVRDDIDTKLSSGEYVVPADVVRFFGVRFFEDLRMQAKEGLAEMDKEGRIGGTPVDDAGIPIEDEEEEEELTPEEEQMLLEALGATDGMAMGGMVEPQYMSNPYQDQTALYQKPYGMAEGGIVPPTPPAVPSPFETSGFDRTTFEIPTTPTGIETRKYYNPTTRETRNISFMNGTPLGAIPVGFVPWTQELQDQTEQATPTAGTTDAVQTQKVKIGGEAEERRNAGETGRTGGGGSNWVDDNRGRLDADPIGVGLDALEKAGLPGGKLGVGLASAINPALGLGVKAVSEVMKVQALGQANTAKKIAEDKGLATDELDDAIDRLADSLTGVAKTAYEEGLVGTGKNNYNQYTTDTGTPTVPPTKTKTGTGGTSTGDGGGAEERRGGATETGGGTNKPTNKTPSKTTATPSGTKTTSSTAGYKEGAKEKPLPTPKAGQSYTEALREEKNTSKTKPSTTTSSGTKPNTSKKGGSVGARAKGGLVTRPEKKEYGKSRKGLAS